MKCPHCLENFFESWQEDVIGSDIDSNKWVIRKCLCPACKRLVIELGKRIQNFGRYFYVFELIKPKGISRSPLPTEVPPEFAEDYKEACLVIVDSPKASAALSRRCLQHLLKERANTKKKDLVEQIQEVLNSKALPSYLSESLDAVRNIGNFAAHPIKSKNTGEIIDIEPGEAEWNLDVLEGLFDFYFVQEAKIKEKKEKLNQKLGEAGKPLIK